MGERERPDVAGQHHDDSLRTLMFLEEVRAHLLALATRERGHLVRAMEVGDERLIELYKKAEQQDLEFARWVDERIGREWGNTPRGANPLPEAVGMGADAAGSPLYTMLAADIIDEIGQLDYFRRAARLGNIDMQLAVVLRSIKTTLSQRIEEMKAIHFGI